MSINYDIFYQWNRKNIQKYWVLTNEIYSNLCAPIMKCRATHHDLEARLVINMTDCNIVCDWVISKNIDINKNRIIKTF